MSVLHIFIPSSVSSCLLSIYPFSPGLNRNSALIEKHGSCCCLVWDIEWAHHLCWYLIEVQHVWNCCTVPWYTKFSSDCSDVFFWFVMPYIMLFRQQFGGTCCLHIQSLNDHLLCDLPILCNHSSLLQIFILKVEALYSSEAWISTCKTAQYHSTEDHNLNPLKINLRPS
jgi:hypothetical protein